MRLRERLVAGLGWLFTRLAIWVAPRPRVPLHNTFNITRGSGVRAWLLFVRQNVVPGAEWHVVTILHHDGEAPIVVDSAVGRCWAWNLQSGDDIPKCLRAFKPEYVVRVRADAKGHMLHSSIGPVTCVTLAKRLIGVHNPGIVTSRQLLALLWEMHDGRS